MATETLIYYPIKASQILKTETTDDVDTNDKGGAAAEFEALICFTKWKDKKKPLKWFKHKQIKTQYME